MIKRIEKILSKYKISQGELSKKLGISRSNISHIFSGRNKPSLDFILKMHKNFPQEDLYWLLTGSTYKQQEQKATLRKEKGQEELYPHLPPLDAAFNINNEEKIDPPSFNAIKEEKEQEEIERIVVFFKNGKCKTYTP